MLGGDGADELLAGYPTFAAERAAGIFRRLPRPAQALAGAAVGRLPVDHRNFSLDFKLKQFLRGAAEPLPLAHQRWLGSFSGAEIARLLVDGDPIGIEAEHLRRAADPRRRRRSALALAGAVSGYVPARGHPDQGRPGQHGLRPGGPGSVPGRRAGRFHAVAARRPSSSAGTRPSDCSSGPAASRLPASILARPKKGFRHPGGALAPRAAGPVDEPAPGPRATRAAGALPPGGGRPPHRRAPVGTRDHRKPLWTLLMFQLWCDHWLG